MWDAFECVRVCVCVCVCRWCSSQLERESGEGAISEQLALIASTLFWWAAALCEMTKCLLSRASSSGPSATTGTAGSQAVGSETVNVSIVFIFSVTLI